MSHIALNTHQSGNIVFTPAKPFYSPHYQVPSHIFAMLQPLLLTWFIIRSIARQLEAAYINHAIKFVCLCNKSLCI